MEIVETKVYTKYITKLMSDDEYKELQSFLVQNPKAGDMIKNSGGLRKLRWKIKDKGKSGGIRNIYYFYENKEMIIMLHVYEKTKQDDLSPKELEILKNILKGIENGR